MVQKMKNTFNSWESWQKVATIILSIQALLIGGIFTFQGVTNSSVNTWIERTAKVETRMDNLERNCEKEKKEIEKDNKEFDERLVAVEIELLDKQYIDLKKEEGILREERDNPQRKKKQKD